MASNEAHPAFPQPEDNAPIWRYMSLAKFLYLLRHRCLTFVRCDCLGDQYEASYTNHDLQKENAILDDLQMHTKNGNKAQEVFSEIRRNLPTWFYVSCWHMGDSESNAMWNQYGLGQEGICIRSFYLRLHSLLPENVHLGKVTYLDYESQRFPTNTTNLYFPVMHKKRYFKDENEIRAVVSAIPIANAKWVPAGRNVEESRDVVVDVQKLVQEVILSPDAPDWMVSFLPEIVAALGYSFTVRKSSMTDPPRR